MTIQDLKDKELIIYEVVSGSKAYGLDTPTSDTDIRGIFVLPIEEVLKGNYIDQVADEKNDIVYFEIKKFLDLARKGNPNILELLNVSDEHILYQDGSAMQTILDNRDIFITKKLRHTFVGYAHSQIKKAKGLNKKINWDKERVEKKDISDFCYVHIGNEKSVKLKKFSELKGYKEHHIGLTAVNNFPNCYAMYFMENGNGKMFGKDRNMIKHTSIPKLSAEVGAISMMRFDINAYSQYCKDYKSYNEWVENRNPERYKMNVKNNGDYDAKNLMHCMRLLHVARDIASGKGIVVKRTEDRDYLMSIRLGQLTYEEILSNSDKLIEEIKELFDNSSLPDEITEEQERTLQSILLDIRTVKCKVFN